MRLALPSLALVLLLAATWVVVGVALAGAGTGVVSAGRTVFAAFGLLLLLGATRKSSSGGPRGSILRPARYTPWQLVVLAGTGVAGYTVLSTVAIALAGPTLPSLVMALSPALVLIIEAVLAKVRVSLPALAATCVAIAGAALYVVPRLAGSAGSAGSAGQDTVLGILAAIGAMISMAVYGLYFAHVNRRYEGPLSARLLPIFALGSLPLVLWAAVEAIIAGSVDLPSLAVLAFLGTVVYVPAYLLQHRILLSAGPAYTSLLGLAVPPLVGVVSALQGIAAPPEPIQLAGMALTLIGMVGVIRLKFAERRSRTAPVRTPS